VYRTCLGNLFDWRQRLPTNKSFRGIKKVSWWYIERKYIEKNIFRIYQYIERINAERRYIERGGMVRLGLVRFRYIYIFEILSFWYIDFWHFFFRYIFDISILGISSFNIFSIDIHIFFRRIIVEPLTIEIVAGMRTQDRLIQPRR
jgi:hypothetical protein